MTLEIRPTGQPRQFDLYEEAEKIGQVRYIGPEGQELEEGLDEEPCDGWSVEMWSLMGTGKTWGADAGTESQARQYAHELYSEFVAERRALNSGGPRAHIVSTPMGGQRRRR
ncbi:hypothetical protein [Streptomyces sp. NPDC059016]|uniref:hypothetical protein n=1 Tax=Streptomyces sp. NPDC059016 TaxID=3346699 RepID=UPI0036A89D6D